MSTEDWAGDRTLILALWPGSKDVGVDEHAHAAPCGGFFTHGHDSGQERHVHEHDSKTCGWCTGAIR